MSNLWEHLKRGVRHSLSTAAERTEELTRLGRVRLDISNLKYNLNKTLQDLGRTVCALADDEKADLRRDARVVQLIERVRELEAALRREEDRLERMRQERKEGIGKAEVAAG